MNAKKSYAGRPALHADAELLADKQAAWLRVLFTDERHVGVEATWGI